MSQQQDHHRHHSYCNHQQHLQPEMFNMSADTATSSSSGAATNHRYNQHPHLQQQQQQQRSKETSYDCFDYPSSPTQQNSFGVSNKKFSTRYSPHRNTLRINPANIPRSLMLNEPTVLEPGVPSFIQQPDAVPPPPRLVAAESAPAAVATSSSSSSSSAVAEPASLPQQRARERRRRRSGSSRPTAEMKNLQDSNASLDLGDFLVVDGREGNSNHNEDNLEESYQLSSCSFSHQVTTLQKELSSSLILDLSNPNTYYGPGGETEEQQATAEAAAENVGMDGGGQHMSASWSGPLAAVDEDVEDFMHYESRPGAYQVKSATSSGGVDKTTARSKRRSAPNYNKSLPNQHHDRRLSSPAYVLKQQQQQMEGGNFRDENQVKETHHSNPTAYRRTAEDKIRENWSCVYPSQTGANLTTIQQHPGDNCLEEGSRERIRGHDERRRRPQPDTVQRGGGAVPHHYYRREGEQNPPIIDNSVPAFDEAFRLRPKKKEGNKAGPRKSRSLTRGSVMKQHQQKQQKQEGSSPKSSGVKKKNARSSIAKAILGKPKLQITKDILNAVSKNSTTKSKKEANIPDTICTFVQ